MGAKRTLLSPAGCPLSDRQYEVMAMLATGKTYGGGPPMTSAQRQTVANDLARGIGNRGQVPRPKYGPGTDGYGPHCEG